MSVFDTVNQIIAQPPIGNPQLAYALASGIRELARRLGRGARTAAAHMRRDPATILAAPGGTVACRSPRSRSC